MQQLTVSNQHYMKSVYKLTQSGCNARVSDIAKELGVSKASACNAIKALEEKGLVTKSTDHKVCLTEEGMVMTCSLMESYNVIRKFFKHILKVEEDSADHQACTLEHTLAPEDLDALTRFMKLYEYRKLAN